MDLTGAVVTFSDLPGGVEFETDLAAYAGRARGYKVSRAAEGEWPDDLHVDRGSLPLDLSRYSVGCKRTHIVL